MQVVQPKVGESKGTQFTSRHIVSQTAGGETSLNYSLHDLRYYGNEDNEVMKYLCLAMWNLCKIRLDLTDINENFPKYHNDGTSNYNSHNSNLACMFIHKGMFPF